MPTIRASQLQEIQKLLGGFCLCFQSFCLLAFFVFLTSEFVFICYVYDFRKLYEMFQITQTELLQTTQNHDTCPARQERNFV